MSRRDPPTGTVTFLFTDIEGSTRLVDQLGSGWPAVLEAHRRTLRDAFSRHGGHEQGTEGDSFFVAFGDAAEAVAAATDGQLGLALEPWPEGAEVRVRMGLHTGRGQVIAGDYFGMDVHRAARIAAAAHGGQVVVSDPTRALVEHDLPSGVQLLDLGLHRLKDLPDPERLFQLLIPGLPTDFPPLKTVGRAEGNLPLPLTAFVGREREVADVGELLATGRQLTLVGPSGIGKTRLAVEAARGIADRYRDGAWFVSLADLQDPAQVPAAIAGAVGVREVGGKPIASVLADHFRLRSCLVVVDNFEHLLPGAPVVTELLAAAPDLTIAVTSQAELRVSGERLYPVPPLGVSAGGEPDLLSDAARLFVERATRTMPELTLDPTTIRLIGEICARLDGLPLAIELAAARVRLLGIPEVARRLDHRLSLLSVGSSDVPTRHRTLREAIAWSFDLLGASEAATFRRFSVFSGGADLAAIERVCVDDVAGDPLATLDDLVRHSLVQVDARVAGSRYRMLQTIREFADERLAESGESGEIRRRHADWCAELLESVAPAVELRPGVAFTAEPELDNVESALRWALEVADVSLGLRICASAWRIWVRQGGLREGLTWTREFLRRDVADQSPQRRIGALEAAGGLAYWLGQLDSSLDAYQERLALASRHGPPEEVADAHLDLVFCFSNVGDRAALEVELGAARSGYEAIGDELGVARCDWMDASGLVMERRFGEARDVLEALLDVFRAHGDANYAGLTVGSLAMCSMALGDLAAANRWFREILGSVEDASVVGTISGLGAWSQLLGIVGRPRLAARLQGAYAALSETYGVAAAPGLQQAIDLVVAQVGPAQELDPEERRTLFEEGRRLTLDDVRDLARTLRDQGALAGEEGLERSSS